jgi:hypothetical protein
VQPSSTAGRTSNRYMMFINPYTERLRPHSQKCTLETVVTEGAFWSLWYRIKEVIFHYGRKKARACLWMVPILEAEKTANSYLMQSRAITSSSTLNCASGYRGIIWEGGFNRGNMENNEPVFPVLKVYTFTNENYEVGIHCETVRRCYSFSHIISSNVCQTMKN